MRKSTLVLVAVAVVVVGFVYWFEFKRTPSEKTKTNPALFHFQPKDVESITFAPAGRTIVVDRQGSNWQIVKPVQTRADTQPISQLLNDITLFHSTRSLTATTKQLKTFGLDPPSLILRFRLKNGRQHLLKVGGPDFTGNSVYVQTGQSKQVLLIPNTVVTDGDRTVAQLRDHTVLGISKNDVKSFDLKTPAGNIQAFRSAKDQSQWAIEKPQKLPGDATVIQKLIGSVAKAKMSGIVSNNADQLARYGLDHPVMSFAVRLQSGAQRTLELGRKKGDQFYARDTSRNMVFLVPASLSHQLDLNLFALRDKKLLRSLPSAFTRIDYRAGSLHFSCGVNNSGKWVMFQPASDKGKKVANWKVFNPLSSTDAKNIISSPPPSLLAAVDFKNPAIVIDLTRTDGAKKTIRISHPLGDRVYVSESDQSGLFQVNKSDLDSLLFKSASDILQ